MAAAQKVERVVESQKLLRTLKVDPAILSLPMRVDIIDPTITYGSGVHLWIWR
jgi:hypothetical protein